jgi:hypothetical protein
MRKGVLVTAGAALVMAVTLWAADPFTPLGISQHEADEQLMSTVLTGNPPYGTALRAFKKMSPAARATVTQDLIAWARASTASPAFRAAYTAYRAKEKPEVPTFATSVDEELKKKQTQQDAEMADSLKGLAALPAEQRKMLEDILKQTAATMKTPQMQDALRRSIVGEREDQQHSYQQALADWQTTFPESPQPLIAKQLHRFLDTSANVDFDAQLVSQRGGVSFANPQYESKSGDWKMCYRAGRETITAARTAAAAWLKEIDAR